jgi:two-component system NarL family sensor kinase
MSGTRMSSVQMHPAVRQAVESILLEERARWAMQIHDGLTQSVTSAVLELQTLRHRIVDDPEGAIAGLGEVEAEIRNDLRKIRELLFEMTSGAAADVPSSLWSFDEDDGSRLPTHVSVEGDLERAPESVLRIAHAIVSEALVNAAKHSGAAEADVRVHASDREIRIEIEDRGRGIAAVTDDDPHFGLRIMRARAESLGGSLDIESTPGHGTRVSAVLPVGGRGEQG